MQKGFDKKRFIFSICVSLLLIVSSMYFLIAGTSSDSSSTSEWLMFGRNLNRTNYYPEQINSTNLTLKWSSTGVMNLFQSPVTVSNGIIYLGNSNNKFYAFNATDGTKLWEYLTTEDMDTGSAVSDGIVYVGSGYELQLYALNATNGTVVWNVTMPSAIFSSPAVYEGRVYIGCNDGLIYSLNKTTGATIWSSATGNYIKSSPAISNGIVYIGSADQKVYAFNATNGSVIWSSSAMPSGIDFASPAISNGIVYIGNSDLNHESVYAFNATNGAQVWNASILGTFTDSSPAISNGIVYIGAGDVNQLYALNATNGSVVWNISIPLRNIPSTPAIAGDVLFIGEDENAEGGHFSAINATTGVYIWNYTLEGFGTSSSPAIANGVIYIGGANSYVYAFYVNSSITTTPGCVESWSCTEFSTCASNGVRSRVCTDSNICNTTTTRPVLSQECTYVGSESGGGSTFVLIDPSKDNYNSYGPVNETSLIPDTSSGGSVQLSFNQTGLGVTSISINVNNSISNASLTIQTVNGSQVNTSGGLPNYGEISQAFRVNLTGMTDADIKNVTIEFKIGREELMRRWKNVNAVRLYRKQDGSVQWTSLPTTFLRYDGNYYYFSAISPGFSTFVVFLSSYECLPGAARCFENNVQLCLGNSTWLVTEKCDKLCEEGKCTSKSKLTLLIYPAIITGISLFILISVYFLFKRISKKKKK